MVHSHAFREYSGGPIVVPKRSEDVSGYISSIGERARGDRCQSNAHHHLPGPDQTNTDLDVWQPSNMCGNSVVLGHRQA